MSIPTGYVITETDGNARLYLEGTAFPLITCPERSQVELFFEKLLSDASYHLFWSAGYVGLRITVPDFDWSLQTQTATYRQANFYKAREASFDFIENHFRTNDVKHLGAHLGRLAFETTRVAVFAQQILDLFDKLSPKGLKKHLQEKKAKENITATKDVQKTVAPTPATDARVFTAKELREMPVGTAFLHPIHGKGQIVLGNGNKMMRFEKYPDTLWGFFCNSSPWDRPMRLLLPRGDWDGEWDVVSCTGYPNGKCPYHIEIAEGKLKFAPNGTTFDLTVNPADSTFALVRREHTAKYSGAYTLQGDELTLEYCCGGTSGQVQYILKRRSMVGRWVNAGGNSVVITADKFTITTPHYPDGISYDLSMKSDVTPAQFTLTLKRSGCRHYRGVFKVEGDRLIMHYNNGDKLPQSFADGIHKETYTRA